MTPAQPRRPNLGRFTPLPRPASFYCAAFAVAFACLPAQAGQRAFVSSAGNDANLAAGCTLASPCRTFQTAHTAVDAGGEIVALDSAGYAPVSITKSLSIIGNPGFIAGITVASGIGVNIATAGVHVVLRNLSITGFGAGVGIQMTGGDSLSIENCVIANLGNGFFVNAAADIRIIDSVMRGNGGNGATIAGTSSAEIVHSQFTGNGNDGVSVPAGTVSVSDSVSSGNGIGFHATAGNGTTRLSVIRSTASNNTDAGFRNASTGVATSHMTVGASMASGNAVGFANSAAPLIGSIATFESRGNNIVRQNTTASSGTITAVPGL